MPIFLLTNSVTVGSWNSLACKMRVTPLLSAPQGGDWKERVHLGKEEVDVADRRRPGRKRKQPRHPGL